MKVYKYIIYVLKYLLIVHDFYKLQFGEKVRLAFSLF